MGSPNTFWSVNESVGRNTLNNNDQKRSPVAKTERFGTIEIS
jgi:hypothetical protein